MHSYTIQRSRRSSLTLTIKPDRTIIVKAPFLVPKIVIEAFVKKHSDWIDKRLEQLSSRQHTGVGNYEEGATFLYKGRTVHLTYGAYTAIRISGDTLFFPKALQFRAAKEFAVWYRKEAEKLITEQVEKYATEMQAEYRSLSFSDTKSRWGACTHDNHLQFNWRLIMAPPLVTNYVIVHELAHTFEKNHSHDFWRIVETYNPSYRQNRKWLKENGHTLVF